ncbi:MAG: hypothetical protein Tsb0010_03370 [Parvularculaceae bacterium]
MRSTARGLCAAGALFAVSAGAEGAQSQPEPPAEAGQAGEEETTPFELDLDAILAPDGEEAERAQEGAQDAPLPTDSQSEALRERLNQFLEESDRAAPAADAAAGARPFGGIVVLRALDKVTARFTDLHVRIDEPTQFGALTIVARACYKRPPEETPETTAFLQVYETGLAREAVAADARAGAAADPALRLDITDAERDRAAGLLTETAPPETGPLAQAPADAAETETATGATDAEVAGPDVAAGLSDLIVAEPEPAEQAENGPDRAPSATAPALEAEGEKIFSGWMFASSPALNPLEHPVYDVWVIDCIAAAPEN